MTLMNLIIGPFAIICLASQRIIYPVLALPLGSLLNARLPSKYLYFSISTAKKQSRRFVVTSTLQSAEVGHGLSTAHKPVPPAVFPSDLFQVKMETISSFSNSQKFRSDASIPQNPQ